MRAISLSLLLASFTALPASAQPCPGAEAQLAKVSKALTVSAHDIAENTLRALIASYPDSPEIVLHQARLAQAKGNMSEAAELYYRHTDKDPDDSRGLAYF